jgi:hypothetical protein
MASLDAYISLVPSENYGQPNFAAWLSAKLQGDVDNQNLLASFPELFNPLTAVGQQLDFVGEWVGISRDLEVPLAGVYFSWGIPGLGWGEGTWFAPGDDPDSLIVLPDDTYRTLVLAKIAANHWDGTIPGAYQVWADVFGPGKILIQDNMDMTLTIIWLGAQSRAWEPARGSRNFRRKLWQAARNIYRLLLAAAPTSIHKRTSPDLVTRRKALRPASLSPSKRISAGVNRAWSPRRSLCLSPTSSMSQCRTTATWQT